MPQKAKQPKMPMTKPPKGMPLEPEDMPKKRMPVLKRLARRSRSASLQRQDLETGVPRVISTLNHSS